MKTQQLIIEIENKIKETQTLITNQKQQLASHENLLQTFIKQLTQIKNEINNKKITKKPWK